jgi:hypothetical protein
MPTLNFAVPLSEMDPDAMIGSRRVAMENGITVKTLRNWTFIGKYPRPEKKNPHGRLEWRVRVVMEQRALHGKLAEQASAEAEEVP